MPYTPPTGWVEKIDVPYDGRIVARLRFHRRRDCSRIRRVDSLIRAERPGSAARCPACAAA